MKTKGKSHGVEGFLHYYADIYGERWNPLRMALDGIGDSVALRFRTEGGCLIDTPGTEPDNDGLPGIPGQAALFSLLPAYHLDRASVIAAESLILPDKGRILDACAAPGGKSLVLASRMSPESVLVANELSADRRRRLRSVLDIYLPKTLRSQVEVTGQDASSLCRRFPQVFGAILLDAPCSSERHVLGDPSALEQWSPARSKNLVFRQWALLSSAFLMLAPGGCLVYSTCSISPGENDGVAGRLDEKYKGKFDFIPPDVSGGERTRFGTMFMPDCTGGSGPIYIARIIKHSNPCADS
ncbi:MAG: 16S rRNA methyltransferase [Rectinemataceae bacterium]|nr:16S rRNA methyltransferase [Rectinemataceae bacterium]